MNFLKLKFDDSFSSGERSNIRRIKFDDPEEIQRLRTIENDPEIAKYVANLQTTDEGLVSLAKGTETKLCVGVVGKESFANPKEVNKLQGRICFYPDEVERFNRLREKKVINNTFFDNELVEVNFAKLPNAECGQMSSGLRQAIKVLRGECAKLKEKIILSAYTKKENINCERLLLSAGFRKSGEIAYHPGDVELNEIWILRLY